MRKEDDGSHGTVGGMHMPIDGGHAFVPDLLQQEFMPAGESDNVRANDGVRLAMIRLGGLDVAARMATSPFAGSAPHVAREAVASSAIEGTPATLAELFGHTALKSLDSGEARARMVREVANAARALGEMFALVDRGEPITLGLIRRTHAILLDGVPEYTAKFVPGELRTIQNRIGGSSLADATYVPPPPGMVEPFMKNLVGYIEHDTRPESAIVRCAVAHYQFEAIHPFPDGNGRVGRILILLMLRRHGILGAPVLGISEQMLARRMEYYAMLRAPRRRGGWARWIAFLADVCAEQAAVGVSDVCELDGLYRVYRRRLNRVTRSPGAAMVLDALGKNPCVTVRSVRKITGLGHAGASDLVRRLVRAGILAAVQGRSRVRLYVARELLGILGRADARADRGSVCEE